MDLGEGAKVLREFALPDVDEILSACKSVIAVAPFRHMVTPGGRTMSVALTNCGQVGWVTDRTGYSYQRCDPINGKPWPDMPEIFQRVAMSAANRAGYANFKPDACLLNRYEPGSRLTLHQDRNEQNFGAPIVSISLGLPAKFLFGGMKRTDRPQRIMLHHGDVAVWGGPSRLAYHGIDTLKDGEHPATGRTRLNLTFRKAL